MATFILVLIFLVAINLGLPDSLLGVSWPIMSVEFGVATGSLGLISLIVSCFTIFTSFFSGKIIKALGNGKVIVFSISLTCIAILAISFTPSFFWLICFSIPLGLGGGAIDTAMNDYVARNYSSRQMNWLHCFWGVGATSGPLIMAAIIDGSSWRWGYRIITAFQLLSVVVLIFCLPRWLKYDKSKQVDCSTQQSAAKSPKTSLKNSGVFFALLSFFLYSGVEGLTGSWGATYLVGIKQFSESDAAKLVSLYYLGITAGRFLLGFVSEKIGDKRLIYIGVATALSGSLLVLLPLGSTAVLYIAFALVGLGCAPVFPSMIHLTPQRFGDGKSAEVIGYQVGAAGLGITVLPPVFGFIADATTFKLYPIVLIVLFALLALAQLTLNAKVKRQLTALKQEQSQDQEQA